MLSKDCSGESRDTSGQLDAQKSTSGIIKTMISDIYAKSTRHIKINVFLKLSKGKLWPCILDPSC